jgi:hypothetical protein
MSAKAFTYCALAALSLLLAAGGDAVANLLVAVARGMKPIVTDFDGASAIYLGGAFVISLAELLTLGAIVAAVATVTRSMMAAVMLPFLVSLAASSAEAYFGSSSAGVPLPNIAADTLRASLDGEATSSILGSVGTLAVWCATGVLLTIGVFQRQDLVTE